MPELPEVETVKNSLKALIVGRKISGVEILRDKSFPMKERQELVKGQKIIDLRRRAKFIDIVLENNYHLLTHLKMTGQLLYVRSGNLMAGGGHPTEDVLQELPGKHTRIIYTLDNNGHLYFNDMRVFGWMKVLDEKEMKTEYARLGPDANAAELTGEYLWKCGQKRKQPIKQVIMDNAVCCGLGNIYAAETLFAAGIDPRREAKSITEKEAGEIVREAKRILNLAISKRGTTFDGRYVDALGEGGNFEKLLQVYGRENEPCRKCGAKIKNVRLGGRSTCFCAHCQI